MKPQETFHNVETGEITVRQISDEEYAALIEFGWTPENAEEATPE